ncbi:MAG: DNA-formamidopyrimidine glycosylase family protein [Desulfurivibrio sp.]|nr:DNA-formamidopyrimidine glycosylase family protein [Desulfurivibrio sp.]
MTLEGALDFADTAFRGAAAPGGGILPLMPELPEVEVVRRGLEPLVVGRRIDSVEASGLSLRRPVPLAALRRWAVGAVISGVGRRAKYLLLYLDNGALVVIHLGMTGKLYPAAGDQPPRKHDHLCLQLAPPDHLEMRTDLFFADRSDVTLGASVEKINLSPFFRTPRRKTKRKKYVSTIAAASGWWRFTARRRPPPRRCWPGWGRSPWINGSSPPPTCTAVAGGGQRRSRIS